MALTADEVAAFEACIASGGVAVFGADTVYGLACDPDDDAAADRLYALKGRDAAKPAAVIAFSEAVAGDLLDGLAPRTRAAAGALLPGPVTLLLPNAGRRFAAACRMDPDTLGVRFPLLAPPVAALAGVGRPVLQTSANIAGGPEARELAAIEPAIIEAADIVLDAGPLAGVASTVIDLRRYEKSGLWEIVREGAFSAAEISGRLAP